MSVYPSVGPPLTSRASVNIINQDRENVFSNNMQRQISDYNENQNLDHQASNDSDQKKSSKLKKKKSKSKNTNRNDKFS